MENRDIKMRLATMIRAYNRDPDAAMLPVLFDCVKTVDPEMWGHMQRCRCAYEFHMMLESLLQTLI